MAYINPARKILADAKRTSAKIDLTANCLACGQSYSHKVAWFERNNFTCPACGGAIDREPLLQMTLAALRDLKSAL
jgi:predicted RNA-binding Zn-ribbon protein involved in translation (DUF1610 family)